MSFSETFKILRRALIVLKHNFHLFGCQIDIDPPLNPQQLVKPLINPINIDALRQLKHNLIVYHSELILLRHFLVLFVILLFLFLKLSFQFFLVINPVLLNALVKLVAHCGVELKDKFGVYLTIYRGVLQGYESLELVLVYFSI